MARQLRITIPEELHARLQEVKNNFKVSEVCEAAIEAAVFVQEATNNPSIDTMIDRLNKEKSEFFKAYKEDGRTAGVYDAMSWSYIKFLSFTVDHVEYDFWDDKCGATSDKQVLAFDSFASSEAHKEWIEIRTDTEQDFSCDGIYGNNSDMRKFASDSYYQGWIEGILSVWKRFSYAA
jgi:hypothetical protein